MHTDTKYRSVRAVLRSRSSDYFFSRWQMIVLLAVVFGMSLAVADAGTKKKLFSIEAQPARHSLTLYARQAQVQLGFSAGVNDIVTNAVIGEYDVSQALELLLEGTGLQAEHGERGITIRPVPRAEGAGSVGEPTVADAETTSLKLVKSLTLPSAQATQQTTSSVAGRSVTNQHVQPTQEFDNIIVTGTNLRGVTNPASPVIIFNREDIELAGHTRLVEFIQSMPQNFLGGLSDTAVNVPGSGEAGNVGVGTSVNLRGLGADSTLVLVNGRRIAPAGLGSFVDISTIPLSAVERIEVVTDGSSAIYGSDAIGGVVNIILREELDGAETTVRYGTVTSGGRREWRASQALGTSWSSGRGFVNYEYLKETPLRSTDREYTALSPSPYDLTSDIRTHSVFANVSQDLSSRISLFSTGNWASRDTVSNTVLAVGTGFDAPLDAAVTQYGGSLGLEVDFLESWKAELSTTYSKYSNDTVNELPAFSIVSESNIRSEVLSLDSKADGTLFSASGGAVQLGIGAGLREEKYEPNETSTFERDVTYVFAETLVPVFGTANGRSGFHSLELSAAIRHEDYSDAGQSTDGKIGIVWSPISQIQLRSTFGTSFRAPLLMESSPGRNRANIFEATDPLSPTGTSIGLLLIGNALSTAAPERGTPLTPEDANVLTFGFDYDSTAMPGLTMSITYYDIEFTDRIAEPGARAPTVLVNPAFAPLVIRNPSADEVEALLAVTTQLVNFTDVPDDELTTGGLDFVHDGRTANLAQTNNSGIDFNIGYARDAFRGVVSASLSGTYMLTLEDQIVPGAPFFEQLDTFANPIDLRVRGSFSWLNDVWSTGVFVNYSDEYRDNTREPEAPIASFTTVDLTISYDFAERERGSFLRNTILSFSALNAFDRDPPFVDDSDSFNRNLDVRNGSVLGRLLTFQFSKSW